MEYRIAIMLGRSEADGVVEAPTGAEADPERAEHRIARRRAPSDAGIDAVPRFLHRPAPAGLSPASRSPYSASLTAPR